MNLEQKLMNSLLLFLLFQSCTSINTITFNQSISDGDVLVSNGKNFALGFFSPGSSSNRYVGIWYYKISEQTVVWVANRDNPINNTAGILSITKHGNLLLSSRDIVFWSSNVSDSSMNNCVAQLLDTGNLVLVQSNTNRVIWQSFDYLTNTHLPNMKLGLNWKTGFNWFLTSWKSPDDPGTGVFSGRIDVNGSQQYFYLYKGPVRLWRAGLWNGDGWTGAPKMSQQPLFNFTFVDNGDECYFTYTILNTSIFSRVVVNESGSVQRLAWHDGDRRWIEFASYPKEQCDNYGQCGANGNCNPYTTDEFECTCLPGYEPKSTRDWYLKDGSEGCVRKRVVVAPTCRKDDGFVKVEFAKVPELLRAHVDRNLSLKACGEECLRNCTCRAYASADVREGSGCVSWHGDLMDTRVFSDAGQDLFIRVDAVVLAQYAKKSKSKKKMVAILVVSAVVILLLAVSVLYWLVSARKRAKRGQLSLTYFEDTPRANELDGSKTNSDLPLFEISTIVAATDNFSKKLGQGGFGAVYKGQLLNGQEIAVKRLSQSSGQGIEEFKNEVTLIAKLQHRNLVRLLGFCIQREEKMLVYEYLSNNSLDSFIFDETRRSLLDWRRRFEIICGTARGILYLHQDSRLRIIHRDLKASNVLLDAELNPKISDFGLAKMFRGDQIEGNTNRVVGTYGYMSPEYAMEGLFSIKSDVFSFGVLLIEIITSKKSTSFYHESSSANLIGHVWDLWKEGRSLEMVDSSLGNSYRENEVLRSIQIGLLCVQENAIDRPTMSRVVSMLGTDTTLPSPKKPAFIVRRGYNSVDTASGGTSASINEVTITMAGGR